MQLNHEGTRMNTNGKYPPIGRKNERLNGASEFYFLHSYHLEMADKNAVAAETTYETAFPSVIEKENLFGVQFHPERSHESGRRLLMNFLNI